MEKDTSRESKIGEMPTSLESIRTLFQQPMIKGKALWLL